MPSGPGHVVGTAIGRPAGSHLDKIRGWSVRTRAIRVASHDDSATASLPARIPVGRIRFRLPDGGLGGHRRQGPVRLGRLRSAPRPYQGRRRRLTRHRLLRPLPRGRGAPRRARRRGLPLLGELAARRPGRLRRPQPGWPGLLRPARRRAVRPGHHPRADALPLGHPARARTERRLAEPRHRVPLRRLRGRRRRTPRRPGPDVDHHQRTRRGDAPRLRAGRARPRQEAALRRAARGSPPAARARPRRGRCARQGHRTSGSPSRTPRSGRRERARRTGSGPGSTTRSPTGCSPTRSSPAPTPTRTSRR